MNKAHSDEWVNLMEKVKQFRKSFYSYNTTVDAEVQKNDILLALDDRYDQLIVTKLMSDDYFGAQALEQVWERLIYLVFYGVDEVAAWSIDALQRLPLSKINALKKEIVSLISKYAKENINDDLSLNFGLQLLDRLQYSDEVLEYIKNYKDYMGLDDEDINKYIKDHTVV